ncbi:MAG: M16 family metallopeptidase [Candidatus Aminicenantales bacterium]
MRTRSTLKKRGASRLGGGKRTPALTAVLAVCLGTGFTTAGPATPPPPASSFFVLENGIKVILYEKHDVPLVHISAAINIGSKDEPPGSRGLVHLLEHCILFRGTEFRSGVEIGRDIRGNGAYFNAHTSQDLATFEISLPSDKADFGLANQKEILFDFEIPAEELEKEKEVILEEIGMTLDDPRKYAVSLVYQSLFPDHPYRNPVFGVAEDITAATLETLQAFHRTYFVPSNCSLAVVGDFSLAEMEKKVRAVFGPVRGAPAPAADFPKAALLRKSISIREEMDVREAYLAIGFVGPDYNDPDQYGADLLVEILGRGVNPMLFSALRTRRDLVQTVDMDYSAHQFGGVLVAFFTLDPKDIGAARSEATSFLKRVRSLNFSAKDYLGPERLEVFDYLKSAQNQIRYRSQKSRETGMLLATALARHLLLSKDLNETGEFADTIGRVTSSKLRDVAAKYLSKGEYVVVAIVPGKKS